MRKFFVAAAVAVAFLCGTTTSAEATFQLRYSTNGGATFTTITDNLAGDTDGVSGSIAVATFAGISIHASSTAGTSSTLSTLDLAVSGTPTAGSINLVVQASISGLITAPPPQLLSWRMTSASFITGTAVETERVWVDADGLNTFGTGSILADSGNRTPPSFSGTSFSGATPYTMTNEYRISGTVSAGDSLSIDNNDRITSPAPAGLVLALTGVPVLGLGAWLRRRVVAA